MIVTIRRAAVTKRMLWAGLVLVMVATFAPESIRAANTAYWRFEENGFSEVNRVNLDLNVSSGAAYSTDVVGPSISDGVETFTNTHSYMHPHSTPPTPDSPPSTTNHFIDLNSTIAVGHAFTIEAFIKLDAGGNYNGDELLSNLTIGSGIVFGLDSEGRLRFGATSPNEASFFETTSPAVLSEGSWHHVAAVGTFTNGGPTGLNSVQVQLYEDYAAVGNSITFTSATFTGAVMEPSSTVYQMGPFDGLVDELRVKGQALAPSQFLTVVPEPTSSALLIFSGLAVRLRRR